MLAKLGFFAVLMWLVPVASTADWSEGGWDDGTWGNDDDESAADDDVDDADRAFCQTLINLVEYCGTTCLPDEFADECVDSPPWRKEPCLSFTGCTNFDECMCQPGEDDSDAGDASDNGDDGSGCGGCGVSNAEAGSFLSAGMMGIGMLALVLSRREGKSHR